MHVAQIGCELWHLPFRVESSPVPVDQCSGCESVSHVVEAWAAAMAPAFYYGWTQTHLAGDLRERAPSDPSSDPCALLGDEEGRSRRRGKQLVPLFLVGFERNARGGMHRDESGLAKLRLTDVENPLIEVDIIAIELQRFT